MASQFWPSKQHHVPLYRTTQSFCLVLIRTLPDYHPFRISPLTALLQINANKPCRASIKVLGETPIEQSFDLYADSLSIPVVGLYPNTTNKIVVILKFEGGEIIDTVNVKTNRLPNGFPNIEINKLERTEMEPGLHACDIHFANYGKFNSIPLIFETVLPLNSLKIWTSSVSKSKTTSPVSAPAQRRFSFSK